MCELDITSTTDKKNYTKKQVENEKIFNEIVKPKQNITTMCLFFIKLSVGDGTTYTQRMSEHRAQFPKDKMISNDNDIYKQVHVQRLNVIDSNIHKFVNTRTYNYHVNDFKQLWGILNYDVNAPKPAGESSSPIELIIVKGAHSSPDIKTFFGKTAYKVKDTVWNDDDNLGIYHTYIDYNINKKAKTFNELFKIDNCDYMWKTIKKLIHVFLIYSLIPTVKHLRITNITNLTPHTVISVSCWKLITLVKILV